MNFPDSARISGVVVQTFRQRKMSQRSSITPELAANVMFASDRTCCVCRLVKDKCQIHHVDGNPSNNEFENLAVICLHCHSQAHSTGAFVRDLTPELVHLYNSSWRRIVNQRLSPATAISNSMELAAEALLEASLDCHYWKVRFMGLAGPDLPKSREGEFTDVWDCFAELWVPKYTDEVYRRFLPLFDDGIARLQTRFDRLIQLFADVLPTDFQAMLVRANRQLETERSVYLHLASFAGESTDEKTKNAFFYQRFTGVISVLREISRGADARRESAQDIDHPK